MELDDLKNKWESVTKNAGNQPVLTFKTIDQMTQKKYYAKINKIKYSELAGVIVCLLGLSFIGFNFSKLDTVFLQITGAIMILLLMILPVLSFLSLAQFGLKDDVNEPYVEIIKQFANQKLRFQKYQQINVFLCYLLLVTVIILLPKFFYGKDITYSKYFWTFAFSFGYIFLMFFSKWVKKFYNRSLKQAEELLKETES